MFRKPLFWAIFLAVSVLCTAWAVMHFAEAIPLVTLDVKMDREGALAAAGSLATERGWGPSQARQAVEFSLNNRVQSFVELEAGGKGAYSEMLRGDLYSPYTWVVRRFQEGETNESVVRFRPDGSPYGFREKMAEDEPGASLDPKAAQELAEAAVDTDWSVDLGDYELVEASHEVRPGGRTDHTLVYERPDVQIGEGRYRLRLAVSGDRFTELSHFIKIPEAFSRRYQEMRSANDAIATGSVFAVAIFYLAGGCAVGLFFLMRERWVVWKPALKWAVFIGVLQALMVLNQWPLLWMGYDTAVSSTTFALQQIAVALAQLVGMGAVLALSFIAAESLGRRAFPHHVQLWRAWTGKVAATKSMLGQTIGGYLLIGIFFAYEVWLYFFANTNLDWWTPSSALFDPNVLANYFPWLTSIAISLQAGFWEECLFRAVPIATAALLGRRFGMRWMWIAGAMVLQAVIFGAGHANYPAQPSYARMVELIIPALGFGGLYLIFGLVPAIVFHFAFDVVWFALPLFAANTPGIWLDRGLVIVLTLIPLWVVLRARWRAGSWGEVPADDFNSGWHPPPAPVRKVAEPLTASSGLASNRLLLIAGLGVVGVLVWSLTSSFRMEAPPLTHSDSEARVVAQEELAARNVELAPEWRELSTVQTPLGLGDRFVWQEGGREVYRELFGRYLPPPRRLVRYARFTGDVAERAEEYMVFVAPDGSVQRMAHQLPEGRLGAELEEADARAMALDTIASEYELADEDLEEVSAEPSQLPERRDWTFVFRVPDHYPMETGEARIVIEIAGDEVVETGRFVHVPEEWERAYRNRRSTTQVVQIACVVLLVALYIAGAVLAIVRWSRHRFATATFVVFFGLMAILGAMGLANGFRAGTAQFVTAQPFKLQVAIVIVGGLIATTGLAAVTALLIGLAHRLVPPQPTEDRGPSIAAGLGLGAILAGVAALLTSLKPSLLPPWPGYGGAADSIPWLGAVLGPVGSWITSTALLLLVFSMIHSITGGWQRRQPVGSVLLIGLGIVLAGSEGVDNLIVWPLEGLLTGLVLWALWVLVLRHHLALVPLVTASGAALAAIREAVLASYPGATVGSLVGAVLVLALAYWWFNKLGVDSLAQAVSEPPIAEPETALLVEE
jgi:hypothetical protein